MMVFTTKYMKNQPKKARRVRRYEEGGSVEEVDERTSRSLESPTMGNAMRVAAEGNQHLQTARSLESPTIGNAMRVAAEGNQHLQTMGNAVNPRGPTKRRKGD